MRPVEVKENMRSSVISRGSDDTGPRPRLGCERLISTVTYPPDGRVITGSWDGFLKVWNLAIGEQEGTSMESGNAASSLAVTRDSTKIIGGDEGGTIEVWGTSGIAPAYPCQRMDWPSEPL